VETTGSHGAGFPRNRGQALHVELDTTVILSNESIEKVPTSKKVSKLGHLNGALIRGRCLNVKYGGLFLSKFLI